MNVYHIQSYYQDTKNLLVNAEKMICQTESSIKRYKCLQLRITPIHHLIYFNTYNYVDCSIQKKSIMFFLEWNVSQQYYHEHLPRSFLVLYSYFLEQVFR